MFKKLTCVWTDEHKYKKAVSEIESLYKNYLIWNIIK